MTRIRGKGSGEKESKQGPGHLNSISELLRSISKVLWTIAFLILVAGLGKLLIFRSSEKISHPDKVEKPVLEKIDWRMVNRDIKLGLEKSRKHVEELASKDLDKWTQKLMIRVDEDFLPWYFSYWTQQKMGLEGLLAQIWHWVDSDSSTAAEKITEDVQEEFSSKVLRPQIAQLELERIINIVVAEYSKNLSFNLEKIPKKYNIKKVDWDRYINDISVMTGNVEAGREISISLKVLTGAGVGGLFLMFRSIKPLISRVGAKLSGKMSAKFAAGMATKTGGKVAFRSGGRFIGSIIAIGIIIWDVWDHFRTKKKAMPILRRNIKDYLVELKKSILNDPDFGIMTVIHRLESKIVLGLKDNPI